MTMINFEKKKLQVTEKLLLEITHWNMSLNCVIIALQFLLVPPYGLKENWVRRPFPELLKSV
jgi:hypothetical protein